MPLTHSPEICQVGQHAIHRVVEMYIKYQMLQRKPPKHEKLELKMTQFRKVKKFPTMTEFSCHFSSQFFYILMNPHFLINQ